MAASSGNAPPACPLLGVVLTMVRFGGLGFLLRIERFTRADKAPMPAVLATALAAVLHPPPPRCTFRGMMCLNRSLLLKYDARWAYLHLYR